MRSVELAKVAAAAEALRLRTLAKRQAMRGVYGAVAAVFAIAVLVVVHVLLWQAFAHWMSPILATVALLVVALVVAAIFGVMALRSTPSVVEREALALRAQALGELRQSLTVLSILGQTASLVFRTGVDVGVRRTTTGTLAEIASRIIGR